MNNERTYVVLLNWHGWRDTLACLESLFAVRRDDVCVIVCDNGSTDGSLEHIENWASGQQCAEVPSHPRLARLVDRQHKRPAWCRIDRALAQSGDYRITTPLVMVENGANLGFAAGNNVGLRLALSQPDMTSAWILNNDTLVEPDCLAHMQAELRCAGGRAAVGSVIHFFDRPEVIQALGGNRFNRVTGVAACSEGRFLAEDALPAMADVAPRLDYLSGCSMLLPRAFLEEVGLMSEDYFLYYEEIDWFARARGRFPLRVSGRAHLYHREGSAIGSPSERRPASCFSDFHMQRSRLLFMRKYYPARLLACYLVGALDAGKRILRGRFRNAATVLSALSGRAAPRLPA